MRIEKYNIFNYIAIFLCLCLGYNVWLKFSKNKVFFHPCPALTKNLPILKKIDRMLCLSVGFSWYTVTEKETKKKYIFNIRNGTILLYEPQTKKLSYKFKYDSIRHWDEFLDKFGNEKVCLTTNEKKQWNEIDPWKIENPYTEKPPK